MKKFSLSKIFFLFYVSILIISVSYILVTPVAFFQSKRLGANIESIRIKISPFNVDVKVVGGFDKNSIQLIPKNEDSGSWEDKGKFYRRILLDFHRNSIDLLESIEITIGEKKIIFDKKAFLETWIKVMGDSGQERYVYASPDFLNSGRFQPFGFPDVINWDVDQAILKKVFAQLITLSFGILLIFLFLLKVISNRKIHKLTLKNFLFSIICVSIFFIFAEGLCRFKYSPQKIIYPGLFEYDKDKVYRLKSNIKNGIFEGKVVHTNSFGYRDSEIPVKKGEDTIRILVMGDSVTFGHGVLAEETYPELLEGLLNENIKYNHFDVINTAVPGNSHFQEYYDLKRGLIFKPDIAIIQFVLNDLVEPYNFLKRFGGRGIDYHGVEDISYWHYFFSQRSALYLFLRDVFFKVKFKTIDPEMLRKKAKSYERNSVKDTATSSFQEVWRDCLELLQKEVDLCHRKGIKCILIASPYDFQLLDESTAHVQKLLKDFALNNNVEYIDVCSFVKNEVINKSVKKYKLTKGIKYSDLVARYPDDIKEVWDYYFLDCDHYNPVGHLFLAKAIYPVVRDILEKKKLIEK